MRRWISLLLLTMIATSGCETTEDQVVPGRVSRAEAIRVATAACHEFPQTYPDIPRVRWEKRDGGYWVVDITDPSDIYGKFYMINARGKIIGVGNLPVRGPRDLPPPYEPYYDGPVVY